MNTIKATSRSRSMFLIIIGVLFLAGCNPTSADQNATVIIITTPTITITSTPTFVPTLTLQPTFTETPLPSWVVNFAEPTLSAIADRPPTIQDDLHDKSGGWTLANWCGGSAAKSFVNGEFVLDNCVATRSKMAYTDFVLEIDARFLPGTDTGSVWVIFFRDTGTGPSYAFGADYAGIFWVFKNEPYEPVGIEPDGRVHPGMGSNHVLLIVKGSRFAFYINGQPIYYWEDSTLWQRGAISFKAGNHGDSHNENDHSIVAFDNLKIWDISDLP